MVSKPLVACMGYRDTIADNRAVLVQVADEDDMDEKKAEQPRAKGLVAQGDRGAAQKRNCIRASLALAPSLLIRIK